MLQQHGVSYRNGARKVIDCELKYSKADNSRLDNSRLTIPLGITALQYIFPI